MTDLPTLQTTVQDFLAMAKRPLVWYSLGQDKRLLVTALQRMTTDTDVMNKLLIVYNALPPQEIRDMDKATLAAAGVPAEHHDAMLAIGDGTLLAKLVALIQQFGPLILSILPLILPLLQKPGGASWQDVLTVVEAILAQQKAAA